MASTALNQSSTFSIDRLLREFDVLDRSAPAPAVRRQLQPLLGQVPTLTRFGRVARIEGLGVEVTGAQGAVSLGGQCRITIGKDKQIPCEVVGFRDGRALVMPLGPLDGITLGARADFEDQPPSICPSKAWLGRVVDGFGAPMDGRADPLRALVGSDPSVSPQSDSDSAFLECRLSTPSKALPRPRRLAVSSAFPARRRRSPAR